MGKLIYVKLSRKNVTVKRLKKILLFSCFLMNGIVNSDVRFDIKGANDYLISSKSSCCGRGDKVDKIIFE